MALEDPNKGVLSGRGEKACALHSLDHLVDGHDAFLIRHTGELLLETDLCTFDALQPLQGLLDHDGTGPSRHAIDPQESDSGL